MKNTGYKKPITAGVCLAFCMALPFLTGQIPQIGKMLSPMHIPVFICGFACGLPYGLAVGFIAPLLRSAIFGSPPILPAAAAMAFELAVYGGVAGLLYKLLPKKSIYIYITLIISMVVGRIAWGATSLVIFGAMGNTFTMSLFLSGAFINAVPGIICHIVLVPIIVFALERSGIIENMRNR